MFKTIKKRPLRARVQSSDSDDTVEEEESLMTNEILEQAKELQKLRKRAHGIAVEALAKGETKKEATKKANDPFKKTTGGMVDLAEIKKGVGEDADDAYDTGIGTSFSAETNKRDEDAEMQKYIETELAKRRGVLEAEDDTNTYLTPEQAALMAVPEHLRKSATKKSEEMLSNQMLSGIPEVDLGIDAKLKNIEATEAAKMQLLADQLSQKEGPSHFVPSNMAVNFVQHNRFSIKEPAKKKKEEPKPESKPVLVVGGVREEEVTDAKRKQGQASDDYHFNKFKKQFKR